MLIRHLVCTFVLLVAGNALAEPRHVYLTYSGAPETSIDINIIEPDSVQGVEVRYDTKSHKGNPDAYARKSAATYHPTQLEQADGRTVHAAALTGLIPGTTYYFVAGEPKHGFSNEMSFRTLPGGDEPFRFVNGGDMGTAEHVVPLLKRAAKKNPDFAVIGGDLAYEEELVKGIPRWDAWLDNWQKHMVTRSGRSIPLVLAIGNHEVIDNNGPTLEDRSPWYVGLFGRQAPNIYHEFRVGDMAVFFQLDTGHLVPYEGEQSAWLDRRLAANQHLRYKFAAYHVPLYPAHRPYDGAGSALGRKVWGPIFDRYGLTASFEHHDHVLKRTKPLKNNQVVAEGEGTIYFGDGCFGRNARTIDPNVRWYNEIEQSTPHFWLVDVTKKGLHFQAINKRGKTIDDYKMR